MAEPSSHASLDAHSRARKAEKIDVLLMDSSPDRAAGRLLEIGTGSGVIADFFAAKYAGHLAVHAVDISDQRVSQSAVDFDTYDGYCLPFPDAHFDYVVSNHVVEHVGGFDEQRAHIREIRRVLKASGQAYLASPSRWQFIEPHFGLPALSWLPRSWRDAYVRLCRRGNRYDCDPLTHSAIERLFTACHLHYKNLNEPALRLMLLTSPRSGALLRIMGAVPSSLTSRLYRFSPTMVYLLRPDAEAPR